jgi:nuclear transport factor 2 (NTF2) superfamily protein
MPSPVETAVQTYVRAARERDPAARAKLIESCFAEDTRFVTRSGVIRGRAGVDAMLARALADQQVLGFRMASVIDAAGTTFRYRLIVERRDGTTAEFFDAGEIDADGQIATILAFTGPLADASP